MRWLRCPFFVLSDKDSITYYLMGRSFTLRDLKKALLLSSGGTRGLYCSYKYKYLWELIEAIELWSEIKSYDPESIDSSIDS